MKIGSIVTRGEVSARKAVRFIARATLSPLYRVPFLRRAYPHRATR